MKTPQQTPSELDKAVERLENELAISESDGDQFSRDIKAACDAAKRLKEVEKENGRLSTTIVRLMAENNEQSDQLYTLRTEYKNALEALKTIRDIDRNSNISNMEIYKRVSDYANQALSTPHAIAAMKKENKQPNS